MTYNLRSDFAQGRVGTGYGQVVTGVTEPLEVAGGVLSIRRASADQSGYVDAFAQVLGETKIVSGLTVSDCGTVPGFTNQGITLFGDGTYIGPDGSWLTLRWDSGTSTFVVSATSVGFPARAIQIGANLRLLGGELSITGPVSMCGSPAFPTVLPIASVGGDLVYNPVSGELVGTGGATVPVLAAGQVAFGNNVDLLTSSPDFTFSQTGTGSLLAIWDPGHTLAATSTIDTGFSRWNLSTNAITLSLINSSGNALLVSDTLAQLGKPLTIDGTALGPQLTLNTGAPVNGQFFVNGSGDMSISCSGSAVSTINRLLCQSTVASTSKTTGAVAISGGLGVAGDIYGNVVNALTTAGSQLRAMYSAVIYGTLSCNNTGQLSISSTGNVVRIPSTSRLFVDSTIAASSTSGGLICAGGVKCASEWVIGTTAPQFTLAYDAANYMQLSCLSDGNTVMDFSTGSRLQINKLVYINNAQDPMLNLQQGAQQMYVRVANPVATASQIEVTTATFGLRAANAVADQLTISATGVSTSQPLTIVNGVAATGFNNSAGMIEGSATLIPTQASALASTGFGNAPRSNAYLSGLILTATPGTTTFSLSAGQWLRYDSTTFPAVYSVVTYAGASNVTPPGLMLGAPIIHTYIDPAGAISYSYDTYIDVPKQMGADFYVGTLTAANVGIWAITGVSNAPTSSAKWNDIVASIVYEELFPGLRTFPVITDGGNNDLSLNISAFVAMKPFALTKLGSASPAFSVGALSRPVMFGIYRPSAGASVVNLAAGQVISKVRVPTVGYGTPVALANNEFVTTAILYEPASGVVYWPVPCHTYSTAVDSAANARIQVRLPELRPTCVLGFVTYSGLTANFTSAIIMPGLSLNYMHI
jgi:hypothetical protein